MFLFDESTKHVEEVLTENQFPCSITSAEEIIDI